MTFIWEIKLYQKARGYRVIIKGEGKTVERDGTTPYNAYRSAEIQFIAKPGFFLPDDEPICPHCVDGAEHTLEHEGKP